MNSGEVVVIRRPLSNYFVMHVLRSSSITIVSQATLIQIVSGSIDFGLITHLETSLYIRRKQWEHQKRKSGQPNRAKLQPPSNLESTHVQSRRGLITRGLL